MQPLSARIRLAMEKRALPSQAALARACKVSKPSVTDWLNGKTKTLSAETARLAAGYFGCDRDWIGQGIGAPNWLDIGQHPSKGVAHQKTHPAHTVTPSIEWRTIVGREKLPEQFTTTVPDGAMASRVRAGTECVFRSDTEPRFGDGVLVKDKHGELHFRLYAQGDRPGHWRAKADDTRAYRDLDSENDGLTVVAVFHGVISMGRWSE